MVSVALYRNWIPRIIIGLVAWIYMLSRFSGDATLRSATTTLTNWGGVIVLWAVIPPIIASQILFNYRRIIRGYAKKEASFWKAIVTLSSFLLFCIVAYSGQTAAFPMRPDTGSSLYVALFLFGVTVAIQAIWYVPLTAYTMHSAYKTMKVTSIDAIAFLIPCFIWLGRGMPVIGTLWGGIYDLGYWVLGTFTWGGTVGPTIAGMLTSVVFAIRALVGREKRIISGEV